MMSLGAMNRLRLLTYNTGLYRVRLGRTTIVEPIQHPAERAAHMAEAILSIDADIVALQEVFDDRHLFPLLDALRSSYPFIATGRDTHAPTFFRDHSGLCILSRYPLTDIRHEALRDAALEERLFIVKGMLRATVASPIGDIGLINTHLTSGGMFRDPEGPWMVPIRDKQIDHLVDLCDELPHPIRLVVGDMNTGPEFACANYQRFLSRGLVDAWHLHTDPASRIKEVTWEITNPLNSRELHKTDAPQRIDHAFLHPTSLAHVRVGSVTVVLDEPRVDTPRGRMTVSDHYGLLLELALQTT